MHRSHQVLRSAVGPISSRVNSSIASQSSSPVQYGGNLDTTGGVQYESAYGQELEHHTPPRVHSTTSFNEGEATDIPLQQQLIPPHLQQPSPSHPFFGPPVHLRDVRAIQTRVDGVFDALQTSDHMSPAELCLIKTVRETASDPDIMSKIVNNGSFQEFMTMYVPSILNEQRPQIAESNGSSSGSSPDAYHHGGIFNDFDIDQEYSAERSSPSTSSSVTSEQQFYESDSDDEETNFLRGRTRRMHISTVDVDDNNVVQQRALNRLNELCHQISPDFSAPTGWRTEGRPSEKEEYCAPIEPGITKPTMEGPGVPGVPLPQVEPEQPAPPPQWANPMYLFVVTACVIPITILAVTAVVYPSPKTWGLLKSGFRAVCNRILT